MLVPGGRGVRYVPVWLLNLAKVAIDPAENFEQLRTNGFRARFRTHPAYVVMHANRLGSKFRHFFAIEPVTMQLD
jgi:hypothetical protein